MASSPTTNKDGLISVKTLEVDTMPSLLSLLYIYQDKLKLFGNQAIILQTSVILVMGGSLGIILNVILSLNGIYILMVVFGLVSGGSSFYLVIQKNGALCLLPHSIQQGLQTSFIEFMFGTKTVKETVHLLKQNQQQQSYPSVNTRQMSTHSDESTVSICPSGWVLKNIPLNSQELCLILSVLPMNIRRHLENPIINNKYIVPLRLRNIIVPYETSSFSDEEISEFENSERRRDNIALPNEAIPPLPEQNLRTQNLEKNSNRQRNDTAPSLHDSLFQPGMDEMVLTPLTRSEMDHFSGVVTSSSSSDRPQTLLQRNNMTRTATRETISPTLQSTPVLEANNEQDSKVMSSTSAVSIPPQTDINRDMNIQVQPPLSNSPHENHHSNRENANTKPNLEQIHDLLDYGERFCEENIISSSTGESMDSMSLYSRVLLASSLIAIRRGLYHLEKESNSNTPSNSSDVDERSGGAQVLELSSNQRAYYKHALLLNRILTLFKSARNGQHNKVVLTICSSSLLLLGLQLKTSKRSRAILRDFLLASSMLSVSTVGVLTATSYFVVNQQRWKTTCAHENNTASSPPRTMEVPPLPSPPVSNETIYGSHNVESEGTSPTTLSQSHEKRTKNWQHVIKRVISLVVVFILIGQYSKRFNQATKRMIFFLLRIKFGDSKYKPHGYREIISQMLRIFKRDYVEH